MSSFRKVPALDKFHFLQGVRNLLTQSLGIFASGAQIEQVFGIQGVKTPFEIIFSAMVLIDVDPVGVAQIPVDRIKAATGLVLDGVGEDQVVFTGCHMESAFPQRFREIREKVVPGLSHREPHGIVGSVVFEPVRAFQDDDDVFPGTVHTAFEIIASGMVTDRIPFIGEYFDQVVMDVDFSHVLVAVRQNGPAPLIVFKPGEIESLHIVGSHLFPSFLFLSHNGDENNRSGFFLSRIDNHILK